MNKYFSPTVILDYCLIYGVDFSYDDVQTYLS